MLTSDVKICHLRLGYAARRDLAVTTGFRDLFAEILEKQVAVQNLFPVLLGYDLSEKKRLGIIAA